MYFFVGYKCTVRFSTVLQRTVRIFLKNCRGCFFDQPGEGSCAKNFSGWEKKPPLRRLAALAGGWGLRGAAKGCQSRPGGAGRVPIRHGALGWDRRAGLGLGLPPKPPPTWVPPRRLPTQHIPAPMGESAKQVGALCGGGGAEKNQKKSRKKFLEN